VRRVRIDLGQLLVEAVLRLRQRRRHAHAARAQAGGGDRDEQRLDGLLAAFEVAQAFLQQVPAGQILEAHPVFSGDSTLVRPS
jgi:hypothetical protein